MENWSRYGQLELLSKEHFILNRSFLDGVLDGRVCWSLNAKLAMESIAGI